MGAVVDFEDELVMDHVHQQRITGEFFPSLVEHCCSYLVAFGARALNWVVQHLRGVGFPLAATTLEVCEPGPAEDCTGDVVAALRLGLLFIGPLPEPRSVGEQGIDVAEGDLRCDRRS